MVRVRVRDMVKARMGTIRPELSSDKVHKVQFVCIQALMAARLVECLCVRFRLVFRVRVGF